MAKVDAFLTLFLDDAPEDFAASVRGIFRRWNAPAAADGSSSVRLPDRDLWAQSCSRWRGRLAAQPDLTTALLGFVASKR